MNPRTMEVIVDARRTYRSDPQVIGDDEHEQ